MVKDLELAKSFKSLWNKPIYLYGAGIYAEQVISLFREFHIGITGVVDSNRELHGKMLRGITIYPLEELLCAATEQEIAVFVTTLSHTSEVVDILERNQICCDIYTLFGLFWAVYFNLNNISINEDVREKYCSIFQTYIYKKKIDVYSNQSNIAINPILSLLQKDESETPVIIYQPGKVGSNSVETTLKEYGVSILRSHGVSYPCEYEKTGLSEIFLQKLKRFEKVKLITLVREPIKKDIGHYFQKITVAENDMGWLVKGIMEKDFQQSFLNYLSVVTPMDFSGGKKEQYSRTVISHIDYIGENNKNGALWGWYEEELKENLGIDILESDFDRNKGYSIIKKDNIEVLVIKLECLNNLEAVLAEFTGLPQISMINTNQGDSKSYKYAYKQFQKEVKLPREYVDFYYKDNEYMKHFYSQSEIDAFYRKWESHIIDM